MPVIDSVQLDHCSFVVPDLDAAADFFTNWLGFDLVSQKGPVQSPDNDHITRTYTMPRQAVGRWAFLQKGAAKLGLVEWKSYGTGINPLRESSAPGACIVLYVGDLEGTVATLKDIPRMNFMDMSSEGFVYATTPFGFQIQLIRANVAI
jgi:hypothetical protein